MRSVFLAVFLLFIGGCAYAEGTLFKVPTRDGVMAQEVPVPKYLQLAREFVANTKPENNEYTNKGIFTRQPGEKDATEWIVHSDCGGFLEDMFRKTKSGVLEQIPTKKFNSRYSIHDFVPAIDADAGFTRITQIEDMRPGDVIGWLFVDKSGHRHDGHIAFIDTTPVKIKSRAPYSWSASQYEVKIIDTSSEIKSSDDTRAPTNSRGVGRATIRLYADDKTGALSGVIFDNGKKLHEQDSDWHIVVGRPRLAVLGEKP
jgi:hypothetical protein